MEAVENKQPALTNFFSAPTFTVELSNMSLVIWIVQHALPWDQFEDTTLWSTFHSVNNSAVVQ